MWMILLGVLASAIMGSGLVSRIEPQDQPKEQVTLPMNVVGGGVAPEQVALRPQSEFKFDNIVHQAYDYSCGSAALTTVLRYHLGYEVTEQQAMEGMLTYGESENEIFLGKDLVHHRNFSEETSRQIDAEVRKIVESAYRRARNILESEPEALEAVAKALLERETISGADVDMLLRGEQLPPQEAPAGTPGGASGTSAAASPASAPETVSGAAAVQATTPEAAPGAGDEFTLEPDDGRHPEEHVGDLEPGQGQGKDPK